LAGIVSDKEVGPVVEGTVASVVEGTEVAFVGTSVTDNEVSTGGTEPDEVEDDSVPDVTDGDGGRDVGIEEPPVGSGVETMSVALVIGISVGNPVLESEGDTIEVVGGRPDVSLGGCDGVVGGVVVVEGTKVGIRPSSVVSDGTVPDVGVPEGPGTRDDVGTRVGIIPSSVVPEGTVPDVGVTEGSGTRVVVGTRVGMIPSSVVPDGTFPDVGVTDGSVTTEVVGESVGMMPS
jgi:hypothetical protein